MYVNNKPIFLDFKYCLKECRDEKEFLGLLKSNNITIEDFSSFYGQKKDVMNDDILALDILDQVAGGGKKGKKQALTRTAKTGEIPGEMNEGLLAFGLALSAVGVAKSHSLSEEAKDSFFQQIFGPELSSKILEDMEKNQAFILPDALQDHPARFDVVAGLGFQMLQTGVSRVDEEEIDESDIKTKLSDCMSFNVNQKYNELIKLEKEPEADWGAQFRVLNERYASNLHLTSPNFNNQEEFKEKVDIYKKLSVSFIMSYCSDPIEDIEVFCKKLAELCPSVDLVEEVFQDPDMGWEDCINYEIDVVGKHYPGIVPYMRRYYAYKSELQREYGRDCFGRFSEFNLADFRHRSDLSLAYNYLDRRFSILAGEYADKGKPEHTYEFGNLISFEHEDRTFYGPFEIVKGLYDSYPGVKGTMMSLAALEKMETETERYVVLQTLPKQQLRDMGRLACELGKKECFDLLFEVWKIPTVSPPDYLLLTPPNYVTVYLGRELRMHNERRATKAK